MSLAFVDTGFVLTQFRYGEADRIVKIFSQDHGVITAFAKGVRRPNSKKAAHLDSLNLIKFQTTRSTSPLYLSQVETVNNYPHIKNSLKKTRSAIYLAELIVNLLPENEPEEAIFNSLIETLTELDKVNSQDERQTLIEFQNSLAELLGYPPPDSSHPEEIISHFERIIGRRLNVRRFRLT